MSVPLRTRAIWGIALTVGIGLLTCLDVGHAADPARQVLPDADYPKMVKYAVKGITDALKGTPDDVKATKARTAAIMIAAYAQQNLDGADGQQRATVRDAAIKLAEAIQSKKFADAVKQAKAIETLAADPKAKKEKLKLLDAAISMHDLMNQFNHPPEGGWGVDRQFYAYRVGMKSKIPNDDLKDGLMQMAYQVAVAVEMVNSKTPKKQAKEWEGFSGDVMKGAVQLAEAVKAKDGGAGMEAIAKITTSCTSCHKQFRESK